MLNNISIGLFIDGGYYAEISKEARGVGLSLKMGELIKFCKKYLADYFNLNESDCQVTEKHFYRGRYFAKAAIDKHIIEQERYFEDSMIAEDIVFHYKHLRVSPINPNDVIEKGIDVWFALDTYEIAIARNLDIVVVMTGDGDHEMLLNKIKALKKKAVLITWNFEDENRVSKLLREEATMHIELDKVLAESRDYSKFFNK